MAITGIVVALPQELCTLTAKKLVKGSVSQLNDQVLVVYSGAGAENARVAAESLIAQGVNRVMSWGCAAALSSELAPGDLLLTNQVAAADKVNIEDDRQWLTSVEAQLSQHIVLHRGALAESLQLVSTMAEKQAFAQATGAIALDMESAAVAKVAKSHHLPFLIVRAIADPLTMSLPRAVARALTSKGELNLVKLAGYLLLHPGELPGLIKLGMHFKAAKKTLKLVAKQLDILVNKPQSV